MDKQATDVLAELDLRVAECGDRTDGNPGYVVQYRAGRMGAWRNWTSHFTFYDTAKARMDEIALVQVAKGRKVTVTA